MQPQNMEHSTWPIRSVRLSASSLQAVPGSAGGGSGQAIASGELIGTGQTDWGLKCWHGGVRLEIGDWGA